MSTITDYLKWRGDISFLQVPLNEVDAYILSKIGALDLSGIVPADGPGINLNNAYDIYFGRTDIDPDYIGRLNQPILSRTLRQLPATERFGGLILSDYIRKVDTCETEQISALTISLPGGPSVITFRGTDDSIVGWQENFMMAVHSAVPAQQDALDYLSLMAKRHPGPLVVMGHSKGGNLAVFSSVMASPEIQGRISAVYNFDGPGFHPEFWAQPQAAGMQSLITNYVSQHTIVGSILYQSEALVICRSRRSGPMAHEALFWEVLGPSFIREEKVTAASSRFGQILNTQIDQMSDEEVRRFIEDLFGSLTSTGAVTLTDLSHMSSEQWYHIIKDIAKTESVKELDKDLLELLFQDKVHLSHVLKRLRQ